MSATSRMAAPAKKSSSMRPPPTRPTTSRTLSAAPVLNGRTSPAESITSTSSGTQKQKSPIHNNGTKRKERDFDLDMGEETNINVVVRCRGRSDREVKENSGVVVSTDGVKGKTVELSMGPSALSNKTYQFDRVFSPAADQGMVFDEVVAPIVDEVLSGFNCTIFAYGQTGTGKTYTMSGEMTDMLPLPDEAGIIPRVLYSLFDKLENQEQESSVKCSFIELYNEELRDLLAVDESVKLKIFDDASRKSQSATLVQGMEESYIKSASRGVQLLREGSYKRQVAATKCNDLSSRSHTVFTVTVYTKCVTDGGEDYVSAGKLNLVDLAGSENIQRSGAENKRAAEAGLINKSLLTLGRVINALVEKGSHIPYRESKLTRLLQDSLGGRTKTCIIATLSPAKSNLEETISTLDYAFRAKNIKNKPQMNQMVSKKTLIREFTAEIEKLKSELIATRQRNGVYLTSETYEEITTESESRRILSEEQRDKIETMEANLRNKAQELFNLTTNLSTVKKDNESIRLSLQDTKNILEKTETVLAHTRQSLAEENMLRNAHQTTERNLFTISNDLISTLGKTTTDINGLHSKLRRRSDLQSLNRTNWSTSQGQVADITTLVEQRMNSFEAQHLEMLAKISARMESFVQEETLKLGESKSVIDQKTAALEKSESEVIDQTSKARDEMNLVLEEVKSLREDVKDKVGQGLDSLAAAAQQISAGVITELEGFHSQLHLSYSSLGKEFKNTFDELTKHLNSQQVELNTLREQLSEAGEALILANGAVSQRLTTILAEEKQQAVEERESIIQQMTSLIRQQGETQDKRIESRMNAVQQDILNSSSTFQTSQESFNRSMDSWSGKEQALVDDMLKSRENVKLKIKKDWTTANDYNTNIQNTTRSVHEETVRIVDVQMKQMSGQLQALDDILSRVRTQNGLHHDAHVSSINGLAATVKESYASITDHLNKSDERSRVLEKTISEQTSELANCLGPHRDEVNTQLAELRTDITSAPMTEYMPTGETPQKTQYQYVSSLPRTEEHQVLIDKFRNPRQSPSKISSQDLTDLAASVISPSKAPVYTDTGAGTEVRANDSVSCPSSPNQSNKPSRPTSAQSGLRELDINIAHASMKSENHTVQIPLQEAKPAKNSESQMHPPSKKQNTGTAAAPPSAEIKDFGASIGSKLSKKATIVAEGRENLPLGGSVGPMGGRNLRSRGS